jgi:uncharacterized membrane protein
MTRRVAFLLAAVIWTGLVLGHLGAVALLTAACGLPALLVLPGAALLDASGLRVDWLERLCLTVGLSVTATAISVLGVQVSGQPIRAVSVGAGVFTVTVVPALAGQFARSRAGARAVPAAAPDADVTETARRAPLPVTRASRIVVLVCTAAAAGLLGAAAAIAVSGERHAATEHFSVLTLVPAAAVNGAVAPTAVEIRNHEGRTVSYRLEIMRFGLAVESREVTLRAGETTDIPIPDASSPGRVVARLYGGSRPAAGFQEVGSGAGG